MVSCILRIIIGMKTLLVVLAHPDDETFGPGGTLAKLSSEGVAVHYLCGTRGESGTVSPERLNGYRDSGELRTAELMCAAKTLGLAGVHFLGLRDSGMAGSSDNAHPDSLHAATPEEVARRIAAFILELKPNAILTHDQFGNYGHPDHVKLHHGVLDAYAALWGVRIDLSRWTDSQGRAASATPAGAAGQAGFSPPKLYLTTVPKDRVKRGVKIMPMFGLDPRRYGRNRDIDLVRQATWDVPITTRVDARAFFKLKQIAVACHASQLAPMTIQNRFVRWLYRRDQGVEHFSRVYPAWAPGEPVEAALL